MATGASGAGSGGSTGAAAAAGAPSAQGQASSRSQATAASDRQVSTPAENAIGWVQAPAGPESEAAAPAGRDAVRRRRSAAGRGAEADVAVAPSKPRTPPKERARAIPTQVRDHFVQVGRDFFFSDGARAFTDRGRKLSTPSENTQVIQDLIAIAQARGWQTVKVSGSDRFRQQAWAAAREAGLLVTGYRASAVEEARLARRQAHEDTSVATGKRSQSYREEHAMEGVREPQPVPSRAREAAPRQHSGRLVDHGIAPYQHDPHEAMSYFVKIETDRGVREVWGVDLERAFKESLSRPQIGDEVVLRAVKREPVTVKSRRESGEGPPIEKEVATHRNRWVVEQRQFLEQREKAAQVLRDPAVAPAQGSRSHPELVGAYLQVHAAELAAKQFRDPQDRERFVALVRSALADSVARGEALPAVRMRQAEVQRRADERGGTSVRESQERSGRGRER